MPRLANGYQEYVRSLNGMTSYHDGDQILTRPSSVGSDRIIITDMQGNSSRAIPAHLVIYDSPQLDISGTAKRLVAIDYCLKNLRNAQMGGLRVRAANELEVYNHVNNVIGMNRSDANDLVLMVIRQIVDAAEL